jgi:opacity protein-like surface antigen
MPYKSYYLSLIIIVSLLIVSTSFAQKGFFGSFKGMPQASAMLIKDTYKRDQHSVDYYFGSASGFEFGYNFTDTIGLSIEFLVSNEGSRLRYEVLDIRHDVRERYEYLRVPIQFVFSGNPSKPVSFRGKVGPSINFLREAETIYISNIFSPRYRGKEEFNSVTLSWTLNIGLAFNVSKHLSLDAGVRSDYSMTSARDDYSILKPLNALDDKEYHPFLLAFELGARFKL